VRLFGRESVAKSQLSSFLARNQIHLDVFEISGTFRSVAAHPSLDTL
jgi:hypothetical protein